MSTFTLGTVPITPLKTVSGADINNVYQVAEEMGNSPAMVKKHYFQAVTKAEAGRFWSIKPD
jgi:hypothetical protein